jgi:hypothetical protein
MPRVHFFHREEPHRPCQDRRAGEAACFFAADDSAAAARRTGLVSNVPRTGALLLALVNVGGWHEAPTTLAYGAAQGTLQ